MLNESKSAGAIIELKEAIELTTNYRVEEPNGIKAYLIDASLIKQVLDQAGCVGIRFYNGYNTAQGTVCPLIVGVTSNDEDMTEGIILDRMRQNPPFEGINSLLQG